MNALTPRRSKALTSGFASCCGLVTSARMAASLGWSEIFRSCFQRYNNHESQFLTADVIFSFTKVGEPSNDSISP